MYSKSVIEHCSSSDSCTSHLSYRLPFDSKLSAEVSCKFQINISDILAWNSVDHDIPNPSSWNQIIFPRGSVLKLPLMSCPCINGIRRSLSTLYPVQPADSVASISESYGGLVNADQLMAVNSINATHPLTTGESLVVPQPCACFNNSNYGAAAVYMSDVVQVGGEFE
ncbi:lysM domain-containing GPI-anchored protein 1-like [Coffea arabica]|uniref:LysM domain-containing GPI-anchored protein 1-like n=1 Tax=Coffea arabica TaxID=13443 RepID=A0ABM4U1Q7_COFAR